MLVFRVENPEGIGPYTSNFSAGDQFDAQYDMLFAHSGDNYPTPSQDKGIERLPVWDEEWCGLLDGSGVVDWFDGFHDDLDEAGFHVSVYDTDDLLIGDSGQVIFRRGTATKINRLPFSELRNLVRGC